MDLRDKDMQLYYIAQRIRELCEVEELSAREFADRIGLSAGAVYRSILEEKSFPKLETILTICREFDIEPNELVGWEEYGR